MNNCLHCSKEVPTSNNYCNWNCHVDAARAAGYRIHLPNNLAPGCIQHDGTILEIEHGDHPDYKHPVEVKWTGKLDEGMRSIFSDVPLTDEELRDCMGEYHALIYVDANIAVTLHETWYYTWYLKTGKHMYGVRQDWHLESLEIPERCLKKSF